MKTMTCHHLGGRGQFAYRAGRADEIIKAPDQHLGQPVAAGDGRPSPALNQLKARWRHPISALDWYRATQPQLAARPELPADAGRPSPGGAI